MIVWQRSQCVSLLLPYHTEKTDYFNNNNRPQAFEHHKPQKTMHVPRANVSGKWKMVVHNNPMAVLVVAQQTREVDPMLSSLVFDG